MTIAETKILLGFMPVMQAYVEGEPIQYRDDEVEDWTDIGSPSWALGSEYRVRPKSIMED